VTQTRAKQPAKNPRDLVRMKHLAELPEALFKTTCAAVINVNGQPVNRFRTPNASRTIRHHISEIMPWHINTAAALPSDA